MTGIDPTLEALRGLRSLVTERMGGLKERCQQQLQNLSSLTKPNPLYHYTDTRGFKGIVCNHELWAGRIDFLNDASEIPYTRDLLKERQESCIS
jgi:hypothetical protein